jgi:AbiTii
MPDVVPPSRQALREALTLSEDVLKNIELSEMPLANIALKVSRLARLLNDFDAQKIMEYEAGGYPSTPDGVAPDIYRLAVKAGRESQEKSKKSGQAKNQIYTTSIEELELELESTQSAIASARDPDISISSANPHQTVWKPIGNRQERDLIRINGALARQRLSTRRSFIYSYVLKRHHELKFSGIADDIFSRIRERVDSIIGTKVPSGVQKLAAAYENLQSENPEDWANAVHSCRRLLQDLASAVYPPRGDIEKEIGGKKKVIKLGEENYINRLVAFLEDRSGSERFVEIVGSHLDFIGDRLDSIFRAAQKGSHAAVTKEEADRYVVYTYLVTGDILTLL